MPWGKDSDAEQSLYFDFPEDCNPSTLCWHIYQSLEETIYNATDFI